MGIKDLRLKAGLSTSSAVKILGISHSMLYKVEQGYRSPSRDLIKRMSLVYECTIEEIFLALDITNSDKLA